MQSSKIIKVKMELELWEGQPYDRSIFLFWYERVW